MTDARGARIIRLIEDPAVGGDLLLVAIGLAAKYDFGLDHGGTTNGLAELLWSTSDMSAFKVRQTFQRDVRTYKPPTFGRGICTAPMVRRSGTCGSKATWLGYLTDWATGDAKPAGGCSRHRAWFESQSRANWAAKPENPPLPCANHGGALVRHFPRVDWRKFWRRLDPSWVEHPEAKPWPKPDLTLLLGDDTAADRDRRLSSEPPALMVVRPLAAVRGGSHG